MLVHADETGDDGVAREIERARSRRDGSVHRRDLAVINDDRLVFARRGASSVDDADVSERDGRVIKREEGFGTGLKAAGRLSCCRYENEKRDRQAHQGD